MAYLPLSTASLPDPVIDPAQGASPEDYFNTVTYSGTSGDKAVTGVGFQPDWVWIKQRNSAADHQLYDVVRGVTKLLESNQTLAEQTKSEGLKSFDSDGFTHGVESAGNDNTGTHVAWNWKANGSGVTNTDGSITSTVSANTTSGFSIVSYTGTGSAATVGHGLDSAPEMVIIKDRSEGVQSWPVFHIDLGATKYLNLNLTSAVATDSNRYPSVPSSTVINIGSSQALNKSGNNFICYAFHSVEGFSKFGSYVGNGSADGPFVYTGFRPAFVMIKNTTYANQWWLLLDSERSTSNVMADTIFPNISNAEQDNDRLDFLSNGFKLRNNYENQNRSGDTFIYMAFAENPFKYSNAR